MSKPTIHELEKILEEDAGEISIKPDGSVVTMPPDFHPDCEDQICAALVREIGRSRTTWASRVEAWEALLMVRRDGRSMAEEARGFAEADLKREEPAQ